MEGDVSEGCEDALRGEDFDAKVGGCEGQDLEGEDLGFDHDDAW